MTPLLEVLRDHGELDRHTAADLVVRHMGLTPEQIALSHETSGKSVIKGRIGWASSALKSCGALIQPKRAHWASGHNAEKLLSLGRPAKLSDIRKFEEYKQHKLRKLEASVGASNDDDLDSAAIQREGLHVVRVVHLRNRCSLPHLCRLCADAGTAGATTTPHSRLP